MIPHIVGISAGHDIDGLLYCVDCGLTFRHDMAVQDRSKSTEVALPPVAALFVVVFDRKVGCVMLSTVDSLVADHCCLATR